MNPQLADRDPRVTPFYDSTKSFQYRILKETLSLILFHFRHLYTFTSFMS